MKIGQKVEFMFPEYSCFDADAKQIHYIERYAVGNYLGKTAGGMARVAFEHTSIEIETVHFALRPIKVSRKKPSRK